MRTAINKLEYIPNKKLKQFSKNGIKSENYQKMQSE